MRKEGGLEKGEKGLMKGGVVLPPFACSFWSKAEYVLRDHAKRSMQEGSIGNHLVGKRVSARGGSTRRRET